MRGDETETERANPMLRIMRHKDGWEWNGGRRGMHVMLLFF